MREDSGRTRRLLCALAYLIATAGAVLTLSRSAWLSVSVGQLIFLGLRRPRLLPAVALAGALAGAALYPIAPEAIRERFVGTFQTGAVYYRTGLDVSLESSAASRLAAHRAGLLMFLDSPIWGQGLDSFRLRLVDYGARYGLLNPITPHSTVLRIATENGLIGLLAFGWLAVAVVGMGWRLRRRGETTERRGFGTLLLATAGASLVSNLFHAGFLGSWLYSSVFWTLFGATAALELEAAPAAARAEVRVPAWRRRASLLRAPSALR
jgi:O-antigen ligase